MTNTKIIFFDLGHVLVHVHIERAVKGFAALSQKPTAEIEQKWEQHRSLFEQFDRGLISREQFYNSILDGKSYINAQKFHAIYASIFELNKDVAEIASRLSENYRLSIISNTDEIHFEKIMNDYRRVMNLFEKPVTSFEAHSLKPEKEIFYYALDKLGCHADEAIFIDDKPENVQAADEIGMRGIQFVSHEQLVTDLQKSGINL